MNRLDRVARTMADLDNADWSMPPVTDETWPALAEHYRRRARVVLAAADGELTTPAPTLAAGTDTEAAVAADERTSA